MMYSSPTQQCVLIALRSPQIKGLYNFWYKEIKQNRQNELTENDELNVEKYLNLDYNNLIELVQCKILSQVIACNFHLYIMNSTRRYTKGNFNSFLELREFNTLRNL